jgi:hypothetical protein
VNFTIPATSKRIITIVVSTLALCTVITISTLSACVILGTQPDPTLITAYVGITTGSLGALTGLLANTRSTPGTDADMPKGTVTTSTNISSETTEKSPGVPTADKPIV